MPMWLNTIIIVILIFSFVITGPCVPKFICVCFKGTCSKSPLAAISAAPLTLVLYLLQIVKSSDNTANSKVLLQR